jgi:uncharacterized surface protein with fasciclin (FAS1) repeats
MQYYKLPVIFFISLLVITGCKKEDLTTPKDKTAATRLMGDFIRNNYDLSLLAAAMAKTGLLDSLNQNGPYTIFAPDNNAFNSIGISSPGAFDAMNIDSLRFVLKYHVLRDRKYISDFPLQMGNKYISLAGPEVNVSVSQGASSMSVLQRFLYVNGAYMYMDTKRNIALANGVIHIIRKPLNYSPVNIQDFLLADSSLSLFVTAMKQFRLWDGLKGKGPLTVFVPTNDAFRKYALTADSIGRMNPDKFETIAFGIYPLMMGTRHIFSTDWSQINDQYGTYDTYIKMPGFGIRPFYNYNNYLNTENSNVLAASADGTTGTYGPQMVNYRNGFAAGADHVTINGIVHVLDDLLLYPQTLRK